jgi:hypothetical protein
MSIRVKNSELSNETIQALNMLIDTDINATSAFRLSRIIKELSSIVEENPEVLETPEPPEPTMSEEDQAIFDEINDVELLELEDAPQWKDPEPFVY